MTITGSGNVFSEVPGNARDSGYITVNYTVPANINNKTYKDPFYRVPSFPGNVKLITKAAYFMNGNTASTVNTAVTVAIHNDTNAEDAMGSITLAAANVIACGDTNYAASALTLASTTSDRSTVSGMTATEPDINVAPGDVLIIKVVADAGSTVTAGSRVQIVLQAADISGN